MIIRAHNLKIITTIALVAMACSGLMSCGGGSRPTGSVSDQMMIQSRTPSQGVADLVVGSPLVSDSSLEAGESFTLSATVSNQGDGESAATTVRYYQSTDATITTSDAAVGTTAVTGLAISGSVGATVDFAAPSNPGSYYYGACVDAVEDESDTTNNCSTSVRVEVTAIASGVQSQNLQQVQSDLVVGSPLVSDSSLETGGSFTLSATVSNDGDGASPATTLRFYRSTNVAVTTADIAVGTSAVVEFSASGSVVASVDLTAPSNPGSYYYGACVDAVEDESDTTNNCSTSVAVTVSQSPPDLMVEVSLNGSYLENGGFWVDATVRNAGGGESVPTMLRLYHSTDTTFTEADTLLVRVRIGALQTQGSHRSLFWHKPSPGVRYYGGCVDAVEGESDTNNNCSDGVMVDIPEPPLVQWDLSVDSLTATNYHTAPYVILTVRVKNAGPGKSPNDIPVRWYRSTDSTITTADTRLSSFDKLNPIAAQGTSWVSLTDVLTPGTYYYGACANVISGESDDSNNCSSSVMVTTVAWDWVMESPAVSDTTPAPGTSFDLSATMRNQGPGTAPSTAMGFYRSQNATISRRDTFLASAFVDEIASQGTETQSITLTAPSNTGTYYYGACVSRTLQGEPDTTNNCSASVRVDIQ